MSESKVSLDPGGSNPSGVVVPNGGSSNNGSDPSEKQKHRVKKLLETYTMTAERSLMGPDQSEAEAYGKYFYQSSNYKLPPDVELSKTSPESAKELVKNNIDLAASKRLQMQMAASVAVASGGLKGGALSPPPQSSMKTPSNGVTLSRIESNAYEDLRSRSNSHLTGEMIRQMNALQKKHGGNASAAAAATALAYQHQLQMQATYERVLREKSYLKYNNTASSTTTNQRANSSSSTATTSSVAAAAAAAAAATAAPVFSARDRGQANLSETRLANRDIACFEVGGEKRCCLPQILNGVLDQFSLPAIHAACDELQIYCSTCTPEQLDVLKLAKIIPDKAPTCGLITKSDAERLCSRLLDWNPPIASNLGINATTSPFSFRVQHECFGHARGIVLPEAYTSPTAKCIECLECEGLFCPAKFVCHSHGRNRENRTCHWGFDSANWRAYLHLADDYTDAEQDKLAKTVESFKAKHCANNNVNHQKRKQDYNGGSGGGGRSSSSERGGSSSLEAKKAKLDEYLPPQQQMSSEDSYRLLLYQTWAAASAAGKTNSASAASNPAAAAAAAAWSSHYAQAIKDGKAPMAPPAGFSMPPPRPSSSTGHNGGSYHRNYEAKMISPSHHHSSDSRLLVKSSPMSDHAESPSERLAQSIESPGRDMVSPRRSSGSKHSSSSLAEDILAIRAALEGASPSARERTLKTLERLTARLALAESERDMALDQLKKLQRRYESTEEELHKKRAELREALRNDTVPVVSTLTTRHPRVAGESGSMAEQSDYTHKKYSSTLPKMELKSPARVMEEKSCGESSRSSRSATPPVSASALMASSTASSVTGQVAESPAELPKMPVSHLRRRSGTPASGRSRESEDLRERMMTMEAELRALKDELSNRGSSSLASTTSSQAGLKEKDEAILEKPENNVANNETEVATSKNNDDDEPSSMQQKKSHNENPVEISAEENT